MSPDTPTPAVHARAVALHSLGWLVAANLVGLWLGVGLLWPAAGDLAAPFTWGRWAPLHMNWHLYGWCSLPLVGALLSWYLGAGAPAARRHSHVALGCWSAALFLGGIAWLGGTVSGKLFLDWHGWSRPLLPLAMVVLWGVLAWHAWIRPDHSREGRWMRIGVLILLLPVPPVLYWAAGRGMYHPVNPDSGGATGAAVLGSTLGVITIFMIVPGFLGVAAKRGVRRFGWALGFSWLVFALIDRGNVSHHAATQIVALATLLFWVPLLPLYWRDHAWPGEAKPWLRMAAAWWGLLVVTGWISFLPGISETFKFTHALVGHAHLAMAGLITSVNAAILVVLTRRAAPRAAFILWQAGCATYIASMLALGWGESRWAAELFRGEAWAQGLLGLRLAGGLAMATASVLWLISVVAGSFQRGAFGRIPVEAGGVQ